MAKLNITVDLADPESLRLAAKALDAFLGLPIGPERPSDIEPPVERPSDVQLAKDTFGRDIPWDARIHAATKTLKKDGAWKLKKGVDKTLVAAVENELFRILNASVYAPPVEEDKVEAPPVEAEKEVETPTDFPSFMTSCTQLVTDETKTLDEINQVLGAAGFSSIQQVVMRPDRIPELWAEINAS